MNSNAKSRNDGRPDGEDKVLSSVDEQGEAGEESQSPSASATVAEADATELQSKISRLEDSLLRAKADLQNAQRRAAAERSEAVRFANAELMKSLLVVLDDFDRAIAAVEKDKDLEALLKGVLLVHANLVKALKDFGLETIDAAGRKFDPTLHEALMQQPTSDAEPGTVLEQVAGGYKLRDRVLRPARVVVAAKE